MSLRWWGVLIALGMMYFGGDGLYTYFTVGEKQQITIEELIEGGPSTGWYEITGAEWNELETLYQENEDTNEIQSGDMLVFVRPQGTDRYAPVHVLLQQESSEIADKINSTRSLNAVIASAEAYIIGQEAQGAEVDEAVIQPAIEASEQMDALFAPHERAGSIEGLVTQGAPGSWSRSEILSAGEGGVASNFVTVEPGFVPEFWRHAGVLVGGLLLLVLVGVFAFGIGRGAREEEWSMQELEDNRQ